MIKLSILQSAISDEANYTTISTPAAAVQLLSIFIGTDGNDRIIGSRSDDEIYGYAGNDILNGSYGGDILHGGDGNDTLWGGFGHDILYGDAGDDSLNGGSGDDELYGGSGNDTLNGGAGSDELWAGSGDDVVYGGDGDDVLGGGGGTDTLYGEDGDDTIYGYWGNATIYGGAGNDTIDAGTGDDLVYGGDGNDHIKGGVGNDEVWAGSGDDVVYGGDGDDILGGGGGTDTLYGEDGDDTIYGYWGNATIYGGAGNDTIDAGTGNDLVYGGEGNDYIKGGAGNDAVWAGSGDDVVEGGDGDDVLGGGGGNDVVDGGNGNDILYGYGGNATIYGGAGEDIIKAGTGDDLIVGGVGNDSLYGGQGADIFRYSDGDGNDTIYDFDVNDSLELLISTYPSDGIGIRNGDDLIIRAFQLEEINIGSDEFMNLYYRTPDDSITIKNFFATDSSGGYVLAENTTFQTYTENPYLINIEGTDGVIFRHMGVAIGEHYSRYGAYTNSLNGYSYGLRHYLEERIENFARSTSYKEEESADSSILGSDQDDVFTAAIYTDYSEYLGEVAFVDGRGGNDQLVGSRVLGGDGDDVLTALEGGTTWWYNGSSTEGRVEYSSALFGEAGDDILYAGSTGKNHLEGGTGNDVLNGQDGVDYLYGAGGHDTLIGGDGKDQLFGGASNDYLDGGEGNDIFCGGRGNDHIIGGTGASNDLYIYHPGDGHDVYEMCEVGVADDNDMLLLFNITPDEVMDGLSRVGDDLVITLSENDSLTFSDAFAGGGMVDQILFALDESDPYYDDYGSDPKQVHYLPPTIDYEVVTSQEIFAALGEDELAATLREQPYDYDDYTSDQYYDVQYSVLSRIYSMEVTGLQETF